MGVAGLYPGREPTAECPYQWTNRDLMAKVCMSVVCARVSICSYACVS